MATDPETAPDEAISPALRRRLQRCFDHGTSLVGHDKYDFDYVTTLFIECVVHDPGNLIYVEAFLDNLQRKYDHNKKGGRAKSSGKSAVKKAASKKDWREALRVGPEVLKANPWDVPTLRVMAEACAALSYNEVELRYLKNALDANPRDADVNRHCGRTLARVGQFDQAIACWHRVEEIKKGDKEATEMISALSLEKAREQAGLGRDRPAGGAAAKQSAARSGKQAAPQTTEELAPSPAPRREIPLTQRQTLERAVAENPADTAKYLQLADLLVDEQRFADAEKTLAKALSAAGQDLRIQQRWEDVQIERAKHQLAIAEKRAAADPSPDSHALVEQMRSDLIRREIEIFGNRADRFPEDKPVRFELAARLRRCGNYAEAIKYYQQARDDETLKAQATLEMGECLQRLKQFPTALARYAEAAEAAAAGSEGQKLALYRAGVLATGMKDLEAANKHLAELCALDPAYKDARDRLDKIEEIRHKS